METHYYAPILEALLSTPDPPTNYALTEQDVRAIAECYDWRHRWEESGWAPGTTEYDSLPAMIKAEPAGFLADISRYYGDDYYRTMEWESEPCST